MRANEYAKFRETDKRKKKKRKEKRFRVGCVTSSSLARDGCENRARRWPRGSLTRYAAHDISERRREDPFLSRRRSRTKRERDLSTCYEILSPSSSGNAGAGALRRESRSIDRTTDAPPYSNPPSLERINATKREWGREYIVINVRRPRVKPRAWCTRASTFDRLLLSFANDNQLIHRARARRFLVKSRI